MKESAAEHVSGIVKIVYLGNGYALIQRVIVLLTIHSIMTCVLTMNGENNECFKRLNGEKIRFINGYFKVSRKHKARKSAMVMSV